MKRHASIIPYSQEHQKVLLLAQVLKTDIPDYRGMPIDIEGKVEMALDYFEKIIYPHEQREEKSLFPEFLGRDKEIDRLVEELIQEHKSIGELMKELKNSPVSEDQLNELGLQLEKHARKEERVLFQLVQEKFSDEELNKMS